MITKNTFADLLNEYLTTRPKRSHYWQRYKDRWWRLCGTYSYKGRRDEVLALYKVRRKRYGTRDLQRMMLTESPVLKMLAKDDCWTGGSLIVPFNPIAKPRPIEDPIARANVQKILFPWVKLD